MDFVKSLSMFHVDAKEIPCVTGEGAPTEKTEGAPGVLYMDTDSGALYKCRAMDLVNEVFIWEKIGEGGTAGVSGTVSLTTEQINALDGMFRACAFARDDVSAEYAAFCTAFGIEDSDEPDSPVAPEITLTSISATYSGGAASVGTAVTDLTGVIVTAHYSDGSSRSVTGYTLSGTISEGSNTVTVTYQGKNATFTVTGVAESGGEETGVSNETTWTSGVAYTFEPIEGSYPDKTTGEIKAYAGWNRSPYLYCAGASTLRGIVRTTSTAFSGTKDNAFYDADKNYVTPIVEFRFDTLASQEAGIYQDIQIPENAAYFIVSAGSTLYSKGCIEYIPYE